MTPTSQWTPDQLAAWERVHAAGRTAFLVRSALTRGVLAGVTMLIVYLLMNLLLALRWQFFAIWSIIWNQQTLLLGLLFVIGFSGIAYLGAAAQWASNERKFQQAGKSHIRD